MKAARRAAGPGFYTLWDGGAADPVPFGLFGGFATIEQLSGFEGDPAIVAHIDATFRKLAVFYGHFLGIRPIRLIFDAAETASLRAETEHVNDRIRRIALASGIPLRHDVECLFLRSRLEGRSLRFDLAASERLNQPRLWSDFVHRSVGYANHLTRGFHLPLVEAWERLSGKSRGVDYLGEQADRVRALSNKASYLLSLAPAITDRLPLAHTTVATLGAGGHPALRYEELKHLLEAEGRNVPDGARIFVKPVWSGGGTEAVILPPGENIRSEEGREYLLQTEVDSGSESERGGLPGRIGINIFIAPDGSPTIQAVGQQLYRDRHCLCHIGSVVDEHVSRRIVRLIGERRILEHARLLHDRTGIAGPIGLDLVYDRLSGNYVDIVDANIRVTAGASAYLFQRTVAEVGHPARAVSVIGNDGMLKLPNLDAGLRSLREAGLLYERDRGAGLVPVPSYKGSGRYDPAFLNPRRAEMAGELAAVQAVGGVSLPQVFSGPSDEASSPSAR